MKKLLIFLLILVIIAGLGIATCPNKQAHKDAIMELVNSKLNKEIDESIKNDNDVMIASAIGSKIIEIALDSRLEVKNYFVYSIGSVGSYDNRRQISLGLFGHVFTMNKDEFSDLVDGLK